MNTLPSIDETYSMIVQVKDQKGLTDDIGNVDSRVAMQIGRAIKYRNVGNTKFKRRMTKEERQKLRCSHCNGVGHEVNECFKFNGYLEWYKELRKRREKARIHCVENDMKKCQKKEDQTMGTTIKT